MKTQRSINHRSAPRNTTLRNFIAALGLATAMLAPAQTPAPIIAPAQTAAPAPTQPANYLAWDADSKDYDARPGDLSAQFAFYVTNVSSEVVVIREAKRSCGCTEAKLPAQPWTMSPGTNGVITATIDLRGKGGRLTKYLTVESSAGSKTLLLNVNIPAEATPPAQAAPVTPVVPVVPATPSSTSTTNMDRSRNIQLATADRQAVFSGDCAKCHVEPTVGKLGKELYVAGCGICHDAEHRAPMVTDLRALKHPTTREYWKQWIAHSKPGSLMPAFAKSEGGPLTDEQITSLADYLVKAIPGAGT